ncbi:hypothetical protein G4B88_008951 [Cannabis sativa]|uniref:Phytocyanin domain-containing protein n=1 Tax=Cannabis sativa TaxID=3483 RepID=A0A7J6HQ29_CANSA|nr:hypothetical protein G4B88_008951 [Cannabis sativa]
MGKSFPLVAIFVFAMAVNVCYAVDYIVGDSAGWNPAYTKGAHNVVQVNQISDYANCYSGQSVPLTSGNDVIPLRSSGAKYFISSVKDDCAKGQKLTINKNGKVISTCSNSCYCNGYTKGAHNVVQVNQISDYANCYSGQSVPLTSGNDVIPLRSSGAKYFISSVKDDCAKAIVLPTIAIATDYIVGDDKGWTNDNFDYQAWAKDKNFTVGDVLVFNYKSGSHNVYKVDGAGFMSCNTTSPNGEPPLTTGNDRVELKTPGNKWYICGKPGHCLNGNQKLKISVINGTASSSDAHGIVSSGFKKIIMLVLIATIIVVPKMAYGTEYVVGDENGWKPNFNYSDWTKDKMFMVGDTLVFNYNSLVHDVYKVNGSDFNDCIARPGSEVLRSGNDVVTLNTTGNKWYLCSKSNHCDLGQKLKISVMDMMRIHLLPSLYHTKEIEDKTELKRVHLYINNFIRNL